MKVLIEKSKIKGKLVIPSSKSYTLRGLILAAMAKGESELLSPLASDDTDAALDVLANLGIGVKQSESAPSGLPAAGGEAAWRVGGSEFAPTGCDLYCRDSAVTFRFMAAICALVPGRHRLVPSPGLAKRPIEPELNTLRHLGAKCQQLPDASIIIDGGPLRGGTAEIPGNISSQFISAILLVAPRAETPIKLKVATNIESRPYILMTMEYLEKFGIKVQASDDLKSFEVTRQEYHPARFRIEGDWTSASYPLALGATLGEVEAENLNPVSLQGDKVIVEYLKEMGAGISVNGDTIGAKNGKLKAIKANLADATDILPTMGTVAALAEGVSEFTGIARARLKESNRVGALKEGLERMGIRVVEEQNRLLVTGGTPHGAVIDTYNDHRLAMAFSILGAFAGDTVINGAECVAKTYPDYWDAAKSLGMKIKTSD